MMASGCFISCPCDLGGELSMLFRDARCLARELLHISLVCCDDVMSSLMRRMRVIEYVLVGAIYTRRADPTLVYCRQ